MPYQFDGNRVSRRWHRVLTRARSEGIKFTVNSGRRTMAEQSALFKQNMQLVGARWVQRPGHPLTAYPTPNAPHIRAGRQNHAIDVDSLDGGETRLQEWLEREDAHPTNPVPGESWHLELGWRDLRRLAEEGKQPLVRGWLRGLLGRRRVSARGVDMVATFEGFRSHVYTDAAGVPTIGFGETNAAIIAKYRRAGITRQQALALLEKRLNRDYAPHVKALKLPLTEAMFDSLTSLTYNLGPGVLAANTGVGQALRKRQWHRAADEMLRWNKAGGRELPGLTRRRQAERDLFLSDLPGAKR